MVNFFFKNSLRIFNYLIGLFVLIIIILISPFRLIRLHPVIGDRLGHFSANIEIFLCEGKSNINRVTNKDLILFFYMPNKFGATICNTQMDIMWKRVININNQFPLYYTYKIITKAKKHLLFLSKFIALPVGHSIDPFGLLNDYAPSIGFNKSEELIGKSLLKDFGLTESDKFICLTCRDSAYLEKEMPGMNWDYHNYRNGDIENFKEAAIYLAKQGFFIFRMGKHVEKSFNLNNSQIIDYANSPLRSDFMDIYLGAKCEFCITTQTGFDGVPHMFRKPLATITMPVGDGRVSNKKSLFITKKHICAITNKEITLKEIFTRGLGFVNTTKDYDEKKVILVDNSPIEIKEMVEEMLYLLNSDEKFDSIKNKHQLKYNEILEKYFFKFNQQKRYGKINSRFSRKFLESNNWWLN